MRNRHVFLSLVLMPLFAVISWSAFADAASGSAAEAPRSGTITVHADRSRGPVNRLVFGHNLEAADSQYIFSAESNPVPGRTGDGIWNPQAQKPVPEVIELARAMGVPTLRYPGGCLTHNFDWKKAVGPVDSRPDYTFGINEYLEVCRVLGAEPVITVSAYVGGPTEAAELVEYLNAPAVEQHPWAMKRAEWGHPEPFGVTYFEMGNESDHGNHGDQFGRPLLKFSPQEYAAWFNACSVKMRAVDPTIKMCALMGTGGGPENPWNPVVLKGVKDTADLIVVHTYSVAMWTMGIADAPTRPDDLWMRACMASVDQFEVMLGKYRDLIKQCTGRAIPMVITEHNAMFVQDLDDPKPYRFSYGPALFSADYLRVMLQPELNVKMAHYWQLLNGYWGMIRTVGNPAQPDECFTMPAYHVFKLWGDHLGSELVHVEAEGPRLEFEGVAHTAPARKPSDAPTPDFTLTSGAAEHCSWEAAGPRSATLTLDDFEGDSYPAFAQDIPVKGGGMYMLTCEARTSKEIGPDDVVLGVSILDARGWEATRSGNAAEGAENTKEWARLACDFNAPADAEAVNLHWRIRGATQPVSGTLEIRNVRIEPHKTYPPYATLTASASLSDDKDTLYLTVFNKHHAEPVAAQVNVHGFDIATARMWRVNGSSLTATNLDGLIDMYTQARIEAGVPEEKARSEAEQELAEAYGGRDVFVRETVSSAAVEGVRPDGFVHTFPAHSMTAFELDK